MARAAIADDKDLPGTPNRRRHFRLGFSCRDIRAGPETVQSQTGHFICS